MRIKLSSNHGNCNVWSYSGIPTWLWANLSLLGEATSTPGLQWSGRGKAQLHPRKCHRIKAAVPHSLMVLVTPQSKFNTVIVKKHYEPVPLIIVEHYNFNWWNQLTGYNRQQMYSGNAPPGRNLQIWQILGREPEGSSSLRPTQQACKTVTASRYWRGNLLSQSDLPSTEEPAGWNQCKTANTCGVIC